MDENTEGHADYLQRRQLAREVSKETLTQTFDALGIDISTPKGRQEFRELISWIRSMERVSKRGGVVFMVTVLSLVITGIVYATWEGLRHFVSSGGQ